MTTRIPARVAAGAAEADTILASLAAAAQNPPANDPPQDPQAAPAAVAPPDPAPPPAPAPSVQPVDMAEIRRLQQQLSTVTGRLDEVNRTNAQLQAQVAQATARPPEPAAPPAPLISDKEREEYGDELLSVVARVVRQEVGTELRDLVAKVNQLEGRLGRMDTSVRVVQAATTQTAQQRYESELDQLLPEWEAINDEPALLDWLQNVDMLSGKKYVELLHDAHNAHDAKRVVHIFRLYKPEAGASAQQPAGPQPNIPPAQVAPAIDPMTLAAPNTQPAAPAPANPPAGKIWTTAEVDKLYDDKQKKRITQQVFEQLEADYLQALAQGRVAA